MPAESERVARPRGLPALFWGASLVGLVAAIVFVGFPQLEFVFTNPFFRGPTNFTLNHPGLGPLARTVFRGLFTIAALATIAGLLLAIVFNRPLFKLHFPHWLYVLLCLLIGPGLIANVLLKDNWGRARPFHVEQYGGKQKFTPVLQYSQACDANCSFVSGEAATIYTVVFAFALLFTGRRRMQLIAAGIVLGTAAGTVRVAQGGHFMSDVVFAGVFMAMTVALIYWLMFERAVSWFKVDGPVHRGLAWRQ